MITLADLINNSATISFDATGADDPSAYGQPYWSIEMEDVTDKTLRGIVDEIDQVARNSEPQFKPAFDKWLSAPYKSSTYGDAIDRLNNRLVVNKNRWTHEDVEDFNVIFYSFIQILNAVMGAHYNGPKEIIIVQ